MFPPHYLNSTAGAGELSMSHYKFHNSLLSLLFCVQIIVPGKIVANQPTSKNPPLKIKSKKKMEPLKIQCIFNSGQESF